MLDHRKSCRLFTQSFVTESGHIPSPAFIRMLGFPHPVASVVVLFLTHYDSSQVCLPRKGDDKCRVAVFVFAHRNQVPRGSLKAS